MPFPPPAEKWPCLGMLPWASQITPPFCVLWIGRNEDRRSLIVQQKARGGRERSPRPRQLGRGETVVPHSPFPVSTLYKEKRNEQGQQKPEAVFELSVLLSQADGAQLTIWDTHRIQGPSQDIQG